MNEIARVLTETQDDATPPVRENMGMGPLAHPETLFVTKYRWTLKGHRLDECFLQKVSFDFLNRVMRLQALEAVGPDDTDFNIQEWLDSDITDEELVFTTYDGCGVPLYTYYFSGIELLGNSAQFDYASSEASFRKVKLRFKSSRRKSHIKKHWFKMFVVTNDGQELGPATVDVDKRPTLEIEETEIRRLNEAMWIPGKSAWAPLSITFDEESQFIAQPLLMYNCKSILLQLCSRKNPCLETWELLSPLVTGVAETKGKKMTLKVRFNEAKYEEAK